MNLGILAGAALGLSLLGAGCATKKYVSQNITPVAMRVAAVEARNGDQDKEISVQRTQLVELDRDLSRTRERLTDTDQKAAAAATEAKAADQRAQAAQTAADGAAAGVRTVTDTLARVDRLNKFKLAKSETVLFAVNQWTLQEDAKPRLTEFSRALSGIDRYIIEVQGFTDKTGSPEANEILSQRRAQEVARYLVNECKIPLRNMTMLGSGYAEPVADDKTRDGRRQNRRVEIRLFVPEVATLAQASAR